MGKFVIGKGLDEFVSLLGDLEWKAPAAAGMAIYEGAKIVADTLHSNISALPTTESKGKIPRFPTKEEKAGMLEGLGIAKKQNKDGFINVKIGMDGYNGDISKKYPRGHPNALIFRSINAGSTVMIRVPLVDKTARSTKAAAEAKMKEVIEREFEKATEKG